MLRFHHYCRTLKTWQLVTFVSVGVFASTAHADIVYNWTFDNGGAGNATGPISGIITFATLNPGGGGGASLTPSSIVITSAPEHVFSAYSVGTEVIGSGLSSPLINWPDYFPWTIDNSDRIIGGQAYFVSSMNEVFELYNPTANAFSFLKSTPDLNMGYHTTLGFSSFNLVTAVPEPSTFSIGLMCTLCFLGSPWRMRRSH